MQRKKEIEKEKERVLSIDNTGNLEGKTCKMSFLYYCLLLYYLFAWSVSFVGFGSLV